MARGLVSGASCRRTVLEERAGPSVVALERSLVSECPVAAIWPRGACDACPIWAGSVARGEAEATETRRKWVEHVVEGAGGACGTAEGVSGGFPGLVVPPRGWILAPRGVTHAQFGQVLALVGRRKRPRLA